MIEKFTGKCLVEKFHGMLLLEACFNAFHKINFNGVLIPSLDASYAITQETIGDRTSQATTHLDLNKN